MRPFRQPLQPSLGSQPPSPLPAPAGTACAWSLSRFPERFEVHVWEALPVPGGVASSLRVKNGEVLLNDQVQGGAPSYR